MNASGLALSLLGVVVIAQVLKGGALQRMGIIGCPATKDTSKPPAAPGLPPQIPPRFSG